ncbi:MAG: OmpA family protein [Deltaproteobacteria bacterium]|nr:OmpA family protein [Deltaproteobacteria bacterium]
MRIVPLSLIASFLFACGVPEEQHNKTLDELKNLKAEMSADRKACADAKAQMERQNQELGSENRTLKTKLTDLGQDVSKLRTQKGDLVRDLGEKERLLAEAQHARAIEQKRAAAFRDLVAKFQNMISAGKLKVRVRRGRMLVQMSDKILFAPGKDKIKSEGQEALKEVASVLAAIPERNFQVAGHTDNVPISTRRFKSNWELSTSRAVNVVKFMTANGVDGTRLSAAGYGPFDPVGDNSTGEGRQENRRIEITLMPSIEELPKLPGQ